MGGKKVFELMLEIGFKSQPLPKKLPNGYTHKWTVFVKGANNTKIEHCVQKVVFQLHDSFPNPNREITEPPYQIKETGYAGFEIPIQIYFKNRDKPNHLVFSLDLILMIDAPHNLVKNQKVSFYNPNREFEKCLIKTGAEMILMNKEKKERSDSPPAKKQKSSSLIPSKDMAKQSAQPTAQSQNATTNHHNHSISASSHHNSSQQNNHHKLSHHSQNSSNHGNQTVRAIGGSNSIRSHNNHHDSKSSNHHTSSAKPKTTPKEFIDVFGAPLVVNNINGFDRNNGNSSISSKNHKSNGGRDSSTNNGDLPSFLKETSSALTTPKIPHKSKATKESQPHSGSKSSHSRSHHKHHQTKSETSHVPQQQVSQQVTPVASQLAQPQQIVPHDPFQTIQHKISSLTDCDRLQKIVDIIEESGEWYNLTASKFEFDLKRLDKKTLYKIEKCLKL